MTPSAINIRRENSSHLAIKGPPALADVILFLGSDAARAINGAALPVYGKG